MLLHWATLEPAGPGRLAAVRFTSPVRVKSLRVFPTGTQPFANADVTTRTEPDAFFFNVYMNAQPIVGAKDKQKATNVLVHSRLAYSGTPLAFESDMGPEYSTRLLVIQGGFESMSMAVYGDVASEVVPLSPEYHPLPLPVVDPVQLHPALDPANMHDHTLLAQQLLESVPKAPPLALAIRLIFCLKPTSTDWDDPEFPCLYASPDNGKPDMDVDECYQLSKRPVSEDATSESVQDFTSSFAARMVNDVQNNERAYAAAGILRNCSCQHFSVAQFLIERLEQADSPFLPGEILDYDILLRLWQAAANADTARYLTSGGLSEAINLICLDNELEPEVRSVAQNYLDRTSAWQTLEDSLLNTRANIDAAVNALCGFTRDDCSFGIWLQNMISHPNVLRKLGENLVLPSSNLPPRLLGQLKVTASHDEFLAFLRAFIGVACVLAVFAWSDSLPDRACQERTLCIIRLWQGVDGYREIVNHLILVPDILERLDYLAKVPTPNRTRIVAEQILDYLTRCPASMLENAFRRSILETDRSMATISDERLNAMQDHAYIASEGIEAVMAQLTSPPQLPPTTAQLHEYRLASAYLANNLQNADNNNLRLLHAFWNNGSQGFLSSLVESIAILASGVESGFSVDPPPPCAQENVQLCYEAANEILGVILRLIPLYPLSARSIDILTGHVSNLFVYTESADAIYSQTSAACVAAQAARQACVEVLRAVCSLDAGPTGSQPATSVMRALLRNAPGSRNDPSIHIQQVFVLVDHVIPVTDDMESGDAQEKWTTAVLPGIISDLSEFFRVLDPGNKAHLARRLIHLDAGTIGIGEWVVQLELQQLQEIVVQIKHGAQGKYRKILEYQTSSSLQVLNELLDPSQPGMAAWTRTIVHHEEPVSLLATCLRDLAELQVTSSHLISLIHELVTEPNLPNELSVAMICTLLLSARDPAQAGNLSLVTALRLLNAAHAHSLDFDTIREPFEGMLGSIALTSADTILPHETASLLFGLMQRYQTPAGWIHLTGQQQNSLLRLLKASLPEHDVCGLDLFPIIDKMDQDEELFDIRPPKPLVSSLKMTTDDIQSLFNPPPGHPVTPPLRAANHTPDMLAQVVVSPAALLRSPSATTGLTKTYTNNAFRDLRAVASARQNTSRLPSMHVDDFQSSQSPEIPPSTGPSLPYQQLALAPPFTL